MKKNLFILAVLVFIGFLLFNHFNVKSKEDVQEDITTPAVVNIQYKKFSLFEMKDTLFKIDNMNGKVYMFHPQGFFIEIPNYSTQTIERGRTNQYEGLD